MYPNRLRQLQEWLKTVPFTSYSDHSRIHLLKSFSQGSFTCYVKREDELGFALSGSKVRKYRTLISFLIHKQVKQAIVIGSSFSNHVLGMTQLLIENEIQPLLFLRGDATRSEKGNALYNRLLVPPEQIRWFSKIEWKNVKKEADEFARYSSDCCLVIPEGGNMPESLPGALSLPLDILRNELENELKFDHIFVDSGTGLMAIALILGLNWLERKTIVQVVLMAEDEVYFLSELTRYHQIFCLWMGFEIPFPSNFKLHFPSQASAFGKVNSAIFKYIRQLAQTEGFLTDPIYTAKLFMTAEQLIKQFKLTGKALIVHSGGALSLAGFQEQLSFR